jgi:hypothetical protein
MRSGEASMTNEAVFSALIRVDPWRRAFGLALQ